MKRFKKKSGYIALMSTIIISFILLTASIEAGSSGWYARFNILGTEAKEQSNSLAEGCAEQAIAKLLTNPMFSGNSTTTYPLGTCYTSPLEINTPEQGLLTIKTRAIVKNAYTNLNIVVNMNNVTYENTGFVSPTLNSADVGGDGNGFEINPSNAYVDDINGIVGSAQNVDGGGDIHKYYGYNFNIPANATLIGIQLRLDWWINSVSGTNNIEADLSWDGGNTWTPVKNTINETTLISNISILGSPTDTWNHNWSTNELSPQNFIVRIKTNSSVASRDFYLDWIPVKISYLNNINNVTNGNFFITPIYSWREVP